MPRISHKVFNESVLVEMERKAVGGEYDMAKKQRSSMRKPPNMFMDIQVREVKEKAVTKHKSASLKKRDNNCNKEEEEEEEEIKMKDISHDSNNKSVKSRSHLMRVHCKNMPKGIGNNGSA
jgi:hypothetical protein